MKESRDFAIINHINTHYDELREELKKVTSFDLFINEKETRKAILFDFLQIGELMNQLSIVFKSNFSNKNTDKLISIRNRIVHGYSSIRDDIIYTTLKNDLPSFIEKLNEFSHDCYREQLKQLLGKKITVYIDRPVGYIHKNIVYPINYGSTEKLTALDGEFQDVYVLDIKEPLNEVSGTVVAIIHREDDIEDKLVVSLVDRDVSEEEIEETVFFQEQYFKHTIIKNK